MPLNLLLLQSISYCGDGHHCSVLCPQSAIKSARDQDSNTRRISSSAVAIVFVRGSSSINMKWSRPKERQRLLSPIIAGCYSAEQVVIDRLAAISMLPRVSRIALQHETLLELHSDHPIDQGTLASSRSFVSLLRPLPLSHGPFDAYFDFRDIRSI